MEEGLDWAEEPWQSCVWLECADVARPGRRCRHLTQAEVPSPKRRRMKKLQRRRTERVCSPKDKAKTAPDAGSIMMPRHAQHHAQHCFTSARSRKLPGDIAKYSAKLAHQNSQRLHLSRGIGVVLTLVSNNVFLCFRGARQVQPNILGPRTTFFSRFLCRVFRLVQSRRAERRRPAAPGATAPGGPHREGATCVLVFCVFFSRFWRRLRVAFRRALSAI